MKTNINWNIPTNVKPLSNHLDYYVFKVNSKLAKIKFSKNNKNTEKIFEKYYKKPLQVEMRRAIWKFIKLKKNMQ